jgi:hypothetical protein
LALWELWHEEHGNKCESLNGFITKYLPKHKHYCRAIINKARPNVAISLDSVGYQEYYLIMFERIGIRRRGVPCEHLHHLDHALSLNGRLNTTNSNRSKISSLMRRSSLQTSK